MIPSSSLICSFAPYSCHNNSCQLQHTIYQNFDLDDRSMAAIVMFKTSLGGGSCSTISLVTHNLYNASSDCFFRRVACHGIATVRHTNHGMSCALGKVNLKFEVWYIVLFQVMIFEIQPVESAGCFPCLPLAKHIGRY